MQSSIPVPAQPAQLVRVALTADTSGASSAPLALRVGQELRAEVLAVAGGANGERRAVLSMAGRRFDAQVPAALQEGQVVRVVVAGVSADRVVLRLVPEAGADAGQPGAARLHDPRAILNELDLPDTPEMRAAVAALVEYGQPVTRAALRAVKGLMAGQPGSVEQNARAAVDLLAKGLPPTSRTIELVRSALSQTPSGSIGDLLRDLLRAMRAVESDAESTAALSRNEPAAAGTASDGDRPGVGNAGGLAGEPASRGASTVGRQLPQPAQLAGGEPRAGTGASATGLGRLGELLASLAATTPDAAELQRVVTLLHESPEAKLLQALDLAPDAPPPPPAPVTPEVPGAPRASGAPGASEAGGPPVRGGGPPGAAVVDDAAASPVPARLPSDAAAVAPESPAGAGRVPAQAGGDAGQPQRGGPAQAPVSSGGAAPAALPMSPPAPTPATVPALSLAIADAYPTGPAAAAASDLLPEAPVTAPSAPAATQTPAAAAGGATPLADARSLLMGIVQSLGTAAEVVQTPSLSGSALGTAAASAMPASPATPGALVTPPQFQPVPGAAPPAAGGEALPVQRSATMPGVVAPGSLPAAPTPAPDLAAAVQALARAFHDRLELQQLTNAQALARTGALPDGSAGDGLVLPGAQPALRTGPAQPGAGSAAGPAGSPLAQGRSMMEGAPAVTFSLPLAFGSQLTTLELAVQREPAARQETPGAAPAATRVQLSLSLAHLGEVGADLRLAGTNLRCHLRAASEPARAVLAAATADLHARWQAAGFSVEALDCLPPEPLPGAAGSTGLASLRRVDLDL